MNEISLLKVDILPYIPFNFQFSKGLALLKPEGRDVENTAFADRDGRIFL